MDLIRVWGNRLKSEYSSCCKAQMWVIPEAQLELWVTVARATRAWGGGGVGSASRNQDPGPACSPKVLVPLPKGTVVGIINDKKCYILWFFINRCLPLETSV